MAHDPRIYVASSWRNQKLDIVVGSLRVAGLNCYDFREFDKGVPAFNWSDIDPAWQSWTPENFRYNLSDPIARRGFDRDMNELSECDALLLVLPCGRSAHLELGYAVGAGKPTAILLEPGQEPELMYAAVDRLCLDVAEAVEFLKEATGQAVPRG